MVDLSSNYIGDAGTSAIIKAIKQSTSLNTLNLIGNSIGDVVFSAIIEAMASRRFSRV